MIDNTHPLLIILLVFFCPLTILYPRLLTIILITISYLCNINFKVILKI